MYRYVRKKKQKFQVTVERRKGREKRDEKKKRIERVKVTKRIRESLMNNRKNKKTINILGFFLTF